MMRLVFYSDSAFYGGHEVMALRGMRYLLQQACAQVLFCYHPGNARLDAELVRLREKFDTLELHPLPFASGRLQGLWTSVAVVRIERIRAVLRAAAPDRVLIIQGDIESGSMGLVAAKRNRLFTISYVPMAHRLAAAHGPCLLHRVRDYVNARYLRLPDRYITVCERTKEALRERGVGVAIDVVRNGLDLESYRVVDRAEARRRLGLPRDGCIAGTVGRIRFAQKGQDVLIQAIARFRDRLEGVHFVVVGEGPDQDRLRRLVRTNGLAACVTILPWHDDISIVYSALDLIVMPSRHEGVPLVMLEGMYFGLPVIASDRDGMADMLPQEWRFDTGSVRQLAERLVAVRDTPDVTLVNLNRDTVMRTHGADSFGRTFADAVLR